MSDDKTKEPIKDAELDEVSGGGGTRPPIIGYGPPPTNKDRTHPAPAPPRPTPV